MGLSVANLQTVHLNAVKTRCVLRNIRAELRAKLAIRVLTMNSVFLSVVTRAYATMRTRARTLLIGGSFCSSTFCCPLLWSVQL